MALAMVWSGPGRPAAPRPGVELAAPAVPLDFGDSVFALAAPPSAPTIRMPLPAADPATALLDTGAAVGARVQPMAASVGQAFAFLGSLPALPGRTM
jgi:hypothetical protein